MSSTGVMYGKTMVNIMKPVEDITKVGNGTYSGFHLNERGLIKNLKTDTDYLFVVHVKSNTLTGSTTYSLDFGNTDPNNPNQQACFITRQHLPHDALGTYKFIMRTRDSFDGMAFVSRNQLLNNATGGSITFNYMILEYQEGMENWDIPFFGGICDVKMPILRNVGKNLFSGELKVLDGYIGTYSFENNVLTLNDNVGYYYDYILQKDESYFFSWDETSENVTNVRLYSLNGWSGEDIIHYVTNKSVYAPKEDCRLRIWGNQDVRVIVKQIFYAHRKRLFCVHYQMEFVIR